MGQTHRLALWGWWLAAAASAMVGAYAATPFVQLGLIVMWVSIVTLLRRRVWSIRPFVMALLAAAFFVAIRVIYTMLFGGISPSRAEGSVLWMLPQLWLPGPFSSIHILGSITAEMLLATAQDALRFAVVFVAFGAASSLVDARRMLARVPHVLAGVALTMSIALNLFASLSLVTKQLNTVRILRGERSRWRMLLPLFEQTLERSQAIAMSMLSRGWHTRGTWNAGRDTVEVGDVFGSNASSPQLRSEPALEVRNLSIAFGNLPVLREVSFLVASGSLTVITGATGSGKSTLLAQIRGIIEPGVAQVAGEVFVDGAPASLDLNIGLTSQRADRSFVAATVQEELEFAGRQADVVAAAEDIAKAFELQHLLHRRIEQLSAGEAALVAIAAACVSEPRVLLLDEPIADLDTRAADRLVRIMKRLMDGGTTIVVAEHRPQRLLAVADQVLHLQNGTVNPMSVNAPVESAIARIDVSASASGQGSQLHANGQGLQLYDSDQATKERLLSVSPGSITALIGENGSGKTTLLQSIAFSGKTANPQIALVSHQVDDYFFCSTLADEFRHNDRLHALRLGTTEGLARRLVPNLPPAETHPRDCSAGTRVALAIALQLSLCRPILALDEPTRGLDADARAALAGMLRETAAHQIAVVYATHDDEFVSELADQILLMPANDRAIAHPLNAATAPAEEVEHAHSVTP